MASWTSKEIKLLKKYYPGSSWEYLLDIFSSRTKKSVAEKARRMNIQRKNNSKKWTKKEIKLLYKYYPNANRSKLKKKLPKRTWLAISSKAQKLNIKRAVSWQIDIRKEKLKELYFDKDMNIRECEKHLKCSNQAIISRLREWFPKKYAKKLERVNYKYKVNEIKTIVENSGYKLIKYKQVNGYVRTSDKIIVSCSCPQHKNYEVKINSFILGKRCSKCYFKNNTGKNNPAYNFNLTDEERKNNRFIKKYKKWRKGVYEKDNYTCQICGDNQGGNLVAHHIESYDINKKLRTKTSNGITLCKKCHLEFHKKYGYGNNTKKEWEEFKKYKEG